MHSFYSENPGRPGEEITLDRREADHLFKTLRARAGEEVELLDGAGACALGRVTSRRTLEILERSDAPEPTRKLHLYTAAPRKAKFDTLLKQAAELGVWSIRPLTCERSVAQPENEERQEALLMEGCKQSKNPFLPKILPALSLPEALREIAEKGYHAWYGSVKETPDTLSGGGDDLAWIVGPEGGFTPAEEEALQAAGIRGLNLGPYVLRLETAAVCGLAVLRRLLPALLLGVLLFTGGCGDRREVRNHPLMIRAERHRQEGDYHLAEDGFRRLTAQRPEAPAPYLALANLYDEALDRPAAALYFYDRYLELAPQAADRSLVESNRQLVKARLKRELERESLPVPPEDAREKLEKENALLRRQNEVMRRHIEEQRRQRP